MPAMMPPKIPGKTRKLPAAKKKVNTAATAAALRKVKKPQFGEHNPSPEQEQEALQGGRYDPRFGVGT